MSTRNDIRRKVLDIMERCDMLCIAYMHGYVFPACDVICHVTALDPSEPSTHLTRSAPGDITAKKCLWGDNRDDTLRPLATVSPQKGAIYANLCK